MPHEQPASSPQELNLILKLSNRHHAPLNMVCMTLSQQRPKGADPMLNKHAWYPRSGASTRTNNEPYINNQQPTLEPTYFQ